MIRSFKQIILAELKGFHYLDAFLFAMSVYLFGDLHYGYFGILTVFRDKSDLDIGLLVSLAILSGFVAGLYIISFVRFAARIGSGILLLLCLIQEHVPETGWAGIARLGHVFYGRPGNFAAGLMIWSLTIMATRYFYLAFFNLSSAELDNSMLSTGSTIMSFGEARPLPAELSTTPIRSVTCENFRLLDPAELKRDGIRIIVVPTEFRSIVDDQALIRCRMAGIRILNDIEFREKTTRAVDIGRLSNGWLAYGEILSCGGAKAVARRLFDVALSLVVLTLVAPLMLLTALAIKLDSPGPAFYRQVRIGLLGKPFQIIKFRSMRVDAEGAGAPIWATKRDPRVTRIGRILRLLRIDELPQLINVLQGSMSMIGPRPERPEFVAALAAEIGHYQDRSFAKPGITGWAQVNYPYGASVDDARRKLAFDLYYIKHRSLKLDLRICLATIRVVLFREGSR